MEIENKKGFINWFRKRIIKFLNNRWWKKVNYGL